MNLSEKEKQKISQNLRKEVVENHNLDKLVKKILKAYEK
jgi:DnaJ-domain-containing protein 1